MRKVARACVFVGAIGSLVWLVGCRREPVPAPPAPPAATPAEGEKPADEPAAGEQSQSGEIKAAFAALSAEDRALAEKQKICPVSDEPLGEMGTPIKVQVAGHEVFVCCKHCEDPLLADPAKHLAKIGLTPVEAAPQ